MSIHNILKNNFPQFASSIELLQEIERSARAGATGFSLWGDRLTALPHEIVELTNLTTLSLSDNQLTTLPPEISELTNLTKIKLGGNQLPVPPEILAKKEN